MRKRNKVIHDQNNFGQMITQVPHTNPTHTTDESKLPSKRINFTETTMTSSCLEPTFEINMGTPTSITNPDNTQHLTHDIISKISQLDPESLATVQEFLTQSFAVSSVQHLLPQQQYSVTTTDMSPFLPVGIISEINNKRSDMQQDNKPDFPNNYNLEQVFELPDSMIGYIFNENTNDVVKVKLFENSDGLQTYKPYEEHQQTELPKTPNNVRYFA